MAEEDAVTIVRQDPVQLAQVKVPLATAADAFVRRDAWGRIPITLVPIRPKSIRENPVFTAIGILLAAAAVQYILEIWWIVPVTLPLALALTARALWPSYIVCIPEGASGLLVCGGKYLRTIGSGVHVVPPWINVSHLVTRREIPFDVPIIEAQTKDNVCAAVDTLVTFTITDPYRFVYAIFTDDYDQIMQASCQEALRALIRRVTAEEVIGLTRAVTDDLVETINADITQYGVQVAKVKITYVRPTEEFVRLQEQRQLAVLQQAEQEAVQALAQRRQADADTLARQELLARIEREHDAMQLQIQQAETLKSVSLLEAEAEELRLAKLEERIRTFPRAVQYDQEFERLKIAQTLAGNSAGNTRAAPQSASPGGVAHAFMIHDTAQHGDAPTHPTHPSPTNSNQRKTA